MRARLAALNRQPINATRQPAERIVGCCRDFTVLLLTMVRAAGIPARARVGFATYFACVTASTTSWLKSGTKARDDGAWSTPSLVTTTSEPDDRAQIDPLDVGRDQFLVAGAAWQSCRAGTADAQSFLVDPHLGIVQTRSWPYLRHNVVRDLAALNKSEMPLWDSWGLIDLEPLGFADTELLDRLAELTGSIDPDLSQFRAVCAPEPRLQVPASVTRHDPLGG